MPPNKQGAAILTVSPSRPKLEICNVEKTFRSKSSVTPALGTISLTIGTNEFVCLVGPSGCGKTTLLRMIAGLEKPDTGELRMEGALVESPGPDRMVMFQDATLFPWLNVIENVEFGLRMNRSLSKAERRTKAMEHLELVGLRDFASNRIHELSGGMRQRTSLARALAPEPRMLLMDEPFTALDAMTREQLYFDIQRICAERRKTVVMVTHNVREAACLADTVYVMSSRPGRILDRFTINLPRPRDINNPRLAEAAAEIKESLRLASKSEASL